MSYATLLTELKNGILIATINRPEKMNALNKEVFTDLDALADEISSNPEIKSAIITGAGQKAFVAGADISEFSGLTKESAMALSKRGQDIFFKIENSPKPIIAAVNGFALGGGCELAMACHFRVASDNAKFGQPEVNLGLLPGYGGTQRLTHLVGKGKSMELHMTGAMIDAAEALRLGLVNYVVAPEELLPKCMSLLETANTKAPLAIGECIRCINIAAENKENGFDAEINSFAKLFETEDMKEGASAFMEKRKANFTGK